MSDIRKGGAFLLEAPVVAAPSDGDEKKSVKESSLLPSLSDLRGQF